jgi:RimJ/RimL family protein N-acetyltransferase
VTWSWNNELVQQFPALEAPLSDGIVSLRHFTLNDVAEVTRALQDPEIVRWTASLPTPYTEADAQGWIERHSELWNSGSTAQFAIVDAADGEFMGNIYVIVAPFMLGRAALGYWVAEWGRAREFATRALVIASKWALDVLNPPELYLETLEGNVASERVAEKAGYVFAGYKSEDYTRPASRGTSERLRVREWALRPS